MHLLDYDNDHMACPFVYFCSDMNSPFLFDFGMTNFYFMLHLYIAYSSCSKSTELKMFNDKRDAQVFFYLSSQVKVVFVSPQEQTLYTPSFAENVYTIMNTYCNQRYIFTCFNFIFNIFYNFCSNAQGII
jgi:hypothetical protein